MYTLDHGGVPKSANHKKREGKASMKLFLNGGGDGPQAALAYQRFSEIIDHAKPLLYIPLAMEPERYPGCLAWITEEFKELRLAGINMVSSMEELYRTDFANYCALFLGGGNTYRLLAGLKASGCFEKIADYIRHDGVVFGGSAGAILFGADIDSCACDDNNGTDLTDTAGFDVLNGLSLLCHYTNRSAEKDRQSTEYLLALSKQRAILALPEEDTICINGAEIEVIGARPYYVFKNGERIQRKISSHQRTVESNESFAACVRCRPPKLLWLDKLKAGNLCIPGFVFSLPRAKAKADGQRAVDAVHIIGCKVSHSLAQAAFVQRAHLLQQNNGILGQPTIVCMHLNVRRQIGFILLAGDGGGDNRWAELIAHIILHDQHRTDAALLGADHRA